MSTFLQRFRRFWRSNGAPQPRGFTLIELLVVTLIMVLITATILVRQARFDSSTLLRSLSYSIALSVRSAQVYGTSVLGTTTVQANCTGSFNSGQCYASAYGVYFSTPGSYILFADLNNNGAYDLGEAAQTYQVGTGYSISKYCLTVDGTQHCSTDGRSALTSLTIYFKRPNPEANFAALPPISGRSYDNALICVTATADPTNVHSVSVWSTGQIAVNGTADSAACTSS